MINVISGKLWVEKSIAHLLAFVVPFCQEDFRLSPLPGSNNGGARPHADKARQALGSELANSISYMDVGLRGQRKFWPLSASPGSSSRRPALLKVFVKLLIGQGGAVRDGLLSAFTIQRLL